MEFDAFISYSSKDKTAADAACAVLEAAGIRCWVAPRDILPGHEYAGAIVDAIDRCRVMVLIFSSSANESSQIHREIERAVSKSVPIVPVRIEEVVPTKSMAYFLGAIHWLDAMTPPIEQHLQRLAVTVRAILQADVPPGDAPKALARSSNTRDDAARSDAARRMSIAAAPFIAKNILRPGWLWPALGCVCVALLAASVWLFHNRMQGSTAGPGPVSSPARQQAEVLVPESVPFITDHDQATIRSAYLPAPGHKALAISKEQMGFVSNQSDDDIAISAALDSCQRATVLGGRSDLRCELYALGNAVVYLGGHPPLPPEPWLVRNAAVERPFAAKDVPLIGGAFRSGLAKDYEPSGRYTKALAISPTGSASYRLSQSGPAEAMRRTLQSCGSWGSGTCLIVALDDRFVVSIPATMQVVGFFRPSTDTTLAPDARNEVARRLGNATTGWNAVAVGSGGRPGLALNAADEQSAIAGAMADCGNHDRDCRVIAIGPFMVKSPN